MTPTTQDRLRAYMALHKLTQDDMADRVGCHRNHIGRILRGKTKPSPWWRLQIEVVTQGEIKAEEW